MTTSQMKMQISEVYNTPSWRDSVARMSDGQVAAIYYRFLRENKFNKKKAPTHRQPEEKPQIENIHQITLFECGLRGAYAHE